jgi:hypothetical protein
VPEPSDQSNLNCWERNKKGQIVRNLRLYVIKRPKDGPLDTIYYYSHRFAYDKLGRRILAWYDLMYLGRFYIPNGPDTIRYFYDKQNRLSQEIHRYTTDMGNKREIDTTLLEKFQRESTRTYRQLFFTGNPYGRKNQRTDTVEYRYEPFETGKHLPLHVSQDIGY